MKRVQRISRIKKIREFALKEVQMRYANLLRLLHGVEENISVCCQQENRLIESLYQLYSQKKRFSSDELMEIHQNLGSIRRWKVALLRQKKQLEEQLDSLRVEMLKKKQEKDVMERLEEKFYLDLVKDVTKKEMKEADESAVQRFVRNKVEV